MPATPSHGFTETKGTSRAVADYILANPGKTRAEIYDAMQNQGHHRPTVIAIVTQMVRQQRITESNDLVTANYTEYAPLKSYATWLRMEQKAKTRKPTKAASADAAPKLVTVAASPEFDAEAFANSLTLKQAKAVYEELKKVFG